MIDREWIRTEATHILTDVYGPDAIFRQGQYEAIEATMTWKRTLVVQKTGWGKSLVYFICTKLNRSRGRGMTLVISPLLVLMDNQMEMAQGMGLRCAALNSSVKDQALQDVHSRLIQDQVDMLFTTPEHLLKDEMKELLPRLRIGLFVVDEAHCISDWGHDFRLDYGRIGRIIRGAFSNAAVLATTATANDRVVNDLKTQLGEDVFISRGPLTRDSLHIQVLPLDRKADRYAWLLENLPKLPGTGIIYCLDKRDCDYLASFLQTNGVSAMSYYSRDQADEEKNTQALELFRRNEIKAIVATIKLGMGYDKGDIAFVIHFQCPSSIVTWYQQIGRAGRSLRDAYVFLMSGSEDREINEYFIRTAFPTEEEAKQVIACIGEANGRMKSEIQRQVNARWARVEKALYFMEKEGYVHREKTGTRTYYYPTIKRYFYDGQRYRQITAIRREEMAQMTRLISTGACLSRYAVECLDDKTAADCGKCANCTGRDIFPGLTISEASRRRAVEFIDSRQLTIEPRKQWPDMKRIPPALRLQSGICLSRYGDGGYGDLVARGKYPRDGAPMRFDDQLVGKAAAVLKPLIRKRHITHITAVPSLRSTLVRDFAVRLAESVRIVYTDLLEKTPAPQQKKMENSAFQCQNAMNSFQLIPDRNLPENLLLVDDVVDSRWTLTVCGYKLLEAGCEMVYPFALADSSHTED